MTNSIVWRQFVLVVGLLFSFSLFVVQSIAAHGAQTVASNPLAISVLENATAEDTIDSVCCSRPDSDFKLLDEDGLLIGLDDTPVWLKIEVSDVEGILVFGPLIEAVSFYTPNIDGVGFTVLRSGKTLLPAERWSQNVHNGFPIDGTRQSRTYYTRLDQTSIFQLKPRLEPTQKFEKNYANELFWHTLLSGAALIMMIFNSSLGIINREKLFILNALTVLFTYSNSLILNGIGPSYVWPTLAPYTVEMFDITMMLGSSVAAIFLYVYLKQPKERSLWIEFILVFPALMFLAFLSWIVVPTRVLHFILIAINILNTLYALVALAVLSWKGDERARIMFPTLAIVLVPGNAHMSGTALLGFEPIIPEAHVLEIMIFTEALLFSLVLAYRIRLAQKQADRAYVELEGVQRNVNRLMIEYLDADRRRIAADLHDSAGQGLLAISTRLRRIVSKLELNGPARQEIDSVADYSTGVVRDIRRISHELHPAILDLLGWKSAIEELFSGLETVKQIETAVRFEVDEEDLSKVQQLHLYRVVQEICSNISKHSSATRCTAEFVAISGELTVVISEFGAGQRAITDASDSKPSLGKIVIDQRMKILSGHWSIKSEDDGPTVRLSFPIDPQGLGIL